MKKLRLKPDDLTVESFLTTDSAATRGTVRAENATQFDCTFLFTCRNWDTMLCCQTFEPTCYNWGSECQTGVTEGDCPTAEADSCPGWATCQAITRDGGYTCDGSCTDHYCTICGALC